MVNENKMGAMISKISEIQMNDEMNEIDLGIWNEWNESY